MPQKVILSFRVSPILATAFREGTSLYYGKAWTCFSAALLMFLEADPKTQGEFMARVYDAELREEVEMMVENALSRQVRKIRTRRKGNRSS